MNLMLRLADEVQLQDKNWFFPPIAAIKVGHKGKI
jgi:hypothetical protein